MLATINRAAATAPLVPELALDATSAGWAAPVRATQALSLLAREMIELLTGAALAERIRECASEDCPLVFVDSSRPGARRWCAMERCGNRHKLRALGIPGTTWHHALMASSPADVHRLRDLTRLRRVRDRIDREYAQPLDVEALARGAHMSAGHLSREFKRAYGESPYAYLMTRRIERAMALLRRGDLNVTEVCFAVGCSSLGTFSTRFTELVGVPPSVYRRDAARTTAGMPSCVAKQVTRPIRNREAPAPAPA